MSWLFNILPAPSRVCAIAGVTFTQLVRMRLFLVLAFFGVGFLLLQLIPFHGGIGVEFSGINQLQLIKNITTGAMQLFGVIFCVAATALIIPRDVEDRILYTILCKPVPRLDYLLGKALGIMGILLVMFLLMDGIMCLVLYLREMNLSEQISQALSAQGYSEADIAPHLQDVSDAGVTMNFQRSLILMFLGLCVLTGMCLLISCFTSGTIISMVLGLGFYFVGSFQEQFFAALKMGIGEVGVSQWMQRGSDLLAILIPDFSLYSAADIASSTGTLLSWSTLGQLTLISLAYITLHLLIATWLFSKKEF